MTRKPTLRQLAAEAERIRDEMGSCTLTFETWAELGSFLRALKRDKSKLQVDSIYPHEKKWLCRLM